MLKFIKGVNKMVTKFFFFLILSLYMNVAQAAKVCNGMEIPTYDGGPAGTVDYVSKKGFYWSYPIEKSPPKEDIVKYLPKETIVKYFNIYTYNIITHGYKYSHKEKVLPVALGDSVVLVRPNNEKLVFGLIVLCGKGDSKIINFNVTKIP